MQLYKQSMREFSGEYVVKLSLHMYIIDSLLHIECRRGV